MRAVALGLVALMSFGAEAVAQKSGEQRRAHRPSVVAATDCLSNAILGNETALRHAEAGRWYDAILMIQTCNFEIRNMISQHDRIYGGGGEEFFKGAYFSDLPRALNTRIKPELDRRAALAAERQRNEQAAIAERERARKDQDNARTELLRAEWGEHRKCLNASLEAILPNSGENAEAITTAIMALCRSHEGKLVRLATALYGITQTEAETAIAKGMATRRADVTKEIVVIRAAAQASRGNNVPSGGGSVPASPIPGRSF